MKFIELFETTEEDRALISLSAAIYNKISEYINTDIDYDDEDSEVVHVGSIGRLFDTPISGINNVRINIQGGEPFLRRADEIAPDDVVKLAGIKVYAFWEENTKTIVLNLDYLDSPKMRTVITHELRHVLDEIKSGSFPGGATGYFTARKKEHRKDGPNNIISYRAQPSEINARFTEILDVLATSIIPKAIKLMPENPKSKIMHDLGFLFIKYDIADLFPEKTKSKDYQRLIKRAVDFINKELSHQQSG